MKKSERGKLPWLGDDRRAAELLSGVKRTSCSTNGSCSSSERQSEQVVDDFRGIERGRDRSRRTHHAFPLDADVACVEAGRAVDDLIGEHVEETVTFRLAQQLALSSFCTTTTKGVSGGDITSRSACCRYHA